MSQGYKYADESLSIIAAMDFLKTCITPDKIIETGHSIKSLVSFVEEKHVKNRGLPTDDPGRVVRRALSHLRQSGHAVELIGGNFIFPKDDERVFGTGEDWVYCYYLTIQKKQGDSQFPCTIGRTSGGTIKSIRKYIERQARKAIVDPPKIPLLFRTNECVDLEGAIHRILRLRDQQIDALGDEIFMTNPEEVLEIYDFIIHGDPTYTTRTESRNEEGAKKIRKRLLESRSDDSSEAKSRKSEKYKIYFQSLIDELRKEHAFTTPRRVNGDNYHYFASGIPGITYGAWFRKGGQTAVYVQIDEKGFKKAERLTFFDSLEAHDGEIAPHFNLPLSWERGSEKTYSHISMSRPGDIEASTDELEAIRDWHVESLLKFKTVFQLIIENLLPS